MYDVVTTLLPSCLIGLSLVMQATKTVITSQMGSEFGKIRVGTAELAAHEHLEKSS